MTGYRPLPTKSEDIAAQARRNAAFMKVGYEDPEFRKALEVQDKVEAQRREVAEAIRQAGRDEAKQEEDQPRECPQCGSTETIELTDERQSITVCAGCGSDE
jgi:hypothetical protein